MALVTQQMIRADPELSVIMKPMDQLYYLIRSTKKLLQTYKAVPATIRYDVTVKAKETFEGYITERVYEININYSVFEREPSGRFEARQLKVTYSLLNKDYMSLNETDRFWNTILQVDQE